MTFDLVDQLDRQFGAQMSENRAAYLKEAKKTDPTLHQFMNLMQAGYVSFSYMDMDRHTVLCLLGLKC